MGGKIKISPNVSLIHLDVVSEIEINITMTPKFAHWGLSRRLAKDSLDLYHVCNVPYIDKLIVQITLRAPFEYCG